MSSIPSRILVDSSLPPCVQFLQRSFGSLLTSAIGLFFEDQFNVLQDQLQAERESTQERIDKEHAERENVEEMLKEERAQRDKFIEEERKSRLEFETTMMAKFAQLTQQVTKKRIDKENYNPNLQNTFLQRSSPNRILAPKRTVIS